MKAHFVCTGNIFRSRLAESYFNFLLSQSNRSDITVTSSGVMAKSNQWGDIGWFAHELLKNDNLLSFASPHWTQTTPEILQSQDMVIFMQSFHLHYCQKHFQYTGTNHQVWNIPDIEPDMTDTELLDHATTQFVTIKAQCHHLLTLLIPPS